METNEMKRLCVTAISGLLLLTLIASVTSVGADNPPGNPYTVYGYVTLNGNPAPDNVKVIVSIQNRADHQGFTHDYGMYTVDFDATQGEIANLWVYVYDQKVQPTNNQSFQINHPTPHGYFINLSVNATPSEDDEHTQGGGGGETTTNQAPIADLSAGEPYQGFVNQPITFDGSKSSDPDGHLIAWDWTFGDGSSGTGEITTHTYTQVGSYPVVLTVTDNESKTDTDQTTAFITIANNPPTAPTLTGGPGVLGHKNISYDFQAVSTDADNDTVKYIFSWGDGQTSTTEFFTSGTPATQLHSWSSAGRFVISVKASDNKTESGSTTMALLIDAIYVGDLGYLIDMDGDWIYDLFYSNSTGLTTSVEHEDDGTYRIDSDNDGDWDYIYNPETKQITLYPTEEGSGMLSPLMILGGILGFIVILFLLILLLTRRKKGNPSEETTAKTSSAKKPRKPAS